MVLDGLETGRIGTRRKVLGDATEGPRRSYRKRIAELDDLIALIRAEAL